MTGSLRALLTNIVDYAGYFPPSDLPLDEAIKNFGQYRSGIDHWMLGRFVVPASLLQDLNPHRNLFADAPPFSFSVLSQKPDTREEYLSYLDQAVESCHDFGDRHGQDVEMQYLEARLPFGLDSDVSPSELVSLINQTAEALSGCDHTPDVVFFETGVADNPEWKQAIDALTKAIDQYSQDLEDGLAARLKLRCGGTPPDQIPSVQQVAHTLLRCSKRNVGLKFTAGLHHPFRKHQPDAGTRMHGFINVFTAGLLAWECDLDMQDMEDVLEEESPASFEFSDNTLTWRDFTVPTDRIRSNRQDFLHSFGSCSFDTPRNELNDFLPQMGEATDDNR